MTKRDQLIEIGKELSIKGLISGKSGNVSMRMNNENILISATRAPLGRLESEDLVEIDLDGELILGAKEPSSEKRMHLEIYKARDDVGAVVHTHSPYASAYAFLNKKPRSINYESDLVLADLPIIAYMQPGTQEFANAVKKGLGSKPAALLQRHGVVAVGRDLDEALAIAELVEEVAKVNYLIDTLSGV